jgi:hypothetical protein
MPANPTALSFIGVSKETVVGTYVAPVAYLPVTTFDPQDMTTWLPDVSWRGSMVETYNKVAGPVWSEIKVDGPVYPDTFGYPPMGILGDVVDSGASAPFTHVGSTKNSTTGQPTSQSWNDFDSVDNRGYTGVQWFGLDIKWDGEKFLTYSGTANGFQSATQTKPTYSNSLIPPIPGWLSAVTINSIVTTTLVDAEINIKRKGGPLNTADANQIPYQIFDGEIAVTGKMTLVADAALQLTNYLAGTKIPLDFNFTQGVSAALVQVKFHMSNCNLDLVIPNRNKEYVQYDITFEACANTTDAGASGGQSPIKATLQNAIAAGTYV